MRLVVVGSSGIIGSAVAELLAARHDVVRASRHGDLRVDIRDITSIREMFDRLGPVDGVVCCAGETRLGSLDQVSDEDFDASLNGKVMGQVNLVRVGMSQVRDGGSFTLTSGVFAVRPQPGVSVVAAANGALESFTRAAALELPRGLRLNVVSPGFIEETAAMMGMPGFGALTAAENAQVYADLVEGSMTGQVTYTDELVRAPLRT